MLSVFLRILLRFDLFDGEALMITQILGVVSLYPTYAFWIVLAGLVWFGCIVIRETSPNAPSPDTRDTVVKGRISASLKS